MLADFPNWESSNSSLLFPGVLRFVVDGNSGSSSADAVTIKEARTQSGTPSGPFPFQDDLLEIEGIVTMAGAPRGSDGTSAGTSTFFDQMSSSDGDRLRLTGFVATDNEDQIFFLPKGLSGSLTILDQTRGSTSNAAAGISYAESVSIPQVSLPSQVSMTTKQLLTCSWRSST